MIIVIIKAVIAFFFFLSLYCEISKRYRNCEIHVIVRLLLMVASVIVFAKVAVFATAPILIQLLLLAATLMTARFLYKAVLCRQLRIKNFRLKKMYIEDFYHKNSQNIRR